jgi:hypothetical protein
VCGAQCRERPIEVSGPLCPQSLGSRKVIIGARAAFAGGYTYGVELVRVPAGADAQDQAASGHNVQGSRLVGEHQRRIVRRDEHGRQ